MTKSYEKSNSSNSSNSSDLNSSRSNKQYQGYDENYIDQCKGNKYNINLCFIIIVFVFFNYISISQLFFSSGFR